MGGVIGGLIAGLIIGFVLSKMMGGKQAAAGGGMESMYAAGGDKSDITL